ncbi:MAG: hypothetical protein ACYTGZ_17025 [Planctomycetota bacterium]
MAPRILLSLIVLFVPAYAQEARSKNLDKTGLQWVVPFEDALAKAKTQKRILVIKPVAFGTSPDGGW